MLVKIELISCLVAALVYINTFDAEFVYDDSRAILKNRDVLPGTPVYEIFFNDFWGTRMTHSGSHRSYRPITVLTFRLNYAISGFRPWSYHVTNVILHSITSYLFVTFIRTRIFKSPFCEMKSLFAGLLFAVHPIHTEAVSGVVGRADVLAGFFVLATLICYAKFCELEEVDDSFATKFKCQNESIPSATSECHDSAEKKNRNKHKWKLKKKSQFLRKVESKQVSSVQRFNNIDVRTKDSVRCRKRQNDDVISEGKLRNDPKSAIKPISIHQARAITLFHQITVMSDFISVNMLTWLTVFFAVCALLSKEHGVCALPLCAVYDIWLHNGLGFTSALKSLIFHVTDGRLRRLRIRVYILVGLTIILLFLRVFSWSCISGHLHFTPSFSSSDNPASASGSILVRALTFNYVIAFNTWLLLCPTVLSYDWSMDAIPLVESVFDVLNLYTIVLYTFLLSMFGYILKTLRSRDETLSVVIKHNSFTQMSWKSLRGAFYLSAGPEEKTNFQNIAKGESIVWTIANKNLKANSKDSNCFENENHHISESAIKNYVTDDVTSRTSASKVGKHKQDDYLRQSNMMGHQSLLTLQNVTSNLQYNGNISSVAKSGPNLDAIAKGNPEPTNSSGYATESSVEDFTENPRVPPLLLPSSKYLESTSRHSTDDSGSLCSETSVETLAQNYSMTKQHRPLTDHHVNIVIMALSMTVFPFLPATNLFFYVGFVVAERLLYLPSMGYCVLLAHGAYSISHKISSKIKNRRNKNRFWTVVKVLALLFLVSFASRTILRNQDWKNEYNLYKSGVATSPAKSWANLGNVLKVQNRGREAEMAYRKALQHRCNMADVHYNLGLLYQEQRQFAKALHKYENAIQYRPTLVVAHLNRGIVLAELGRVKEAETVYKNAAGIDDFGLKDPQGHARAQISALYNLGCLLASQDRYAEAVSTFEGAVKRRNSDYEPHSLYNMLGQSLFKLNRFNDAERWFLAALASKPDHVPVYLTYARLLIRQSRISEAEHFYKSALAIEPTNHVIYNHFGKFYMDQGGFEDASILMDKAVKTKTGSEDFDTMMTAANAHRQAKSFDKAEEYYRRTTIIKPESEVSHVNLGAILHLKAKYEEARLSYLEALRIRPNDETTTANLAKLDEALKQKRAR